jgi:hypothetical protein
VPTTTSTKVNQLENQATWNPPRQVRGDPHSLL